MQTFVLNDFCSDFCHLSRIYSLDRFRIHAIVAWGTPSWDLEALVDSRADANSIVQDLVAKYGHTHTTSCYASEGGVTQWGSHRPRFPLH